ncbi:MAG: diguanylate cyclase [Oscillospiraceae bacterium]|nr:diguanylate cyclase [Oscillospiraceae bacterium]
MALLVGIVNLLIPALIIGIILIMGTIAARNIADDTANRMSRQYAIESAANFQTFLNPHMRLMQQMAYSVPIARWLASEDDITQRAYAFNSMMSYAANIHHIYFMFTFYDTHKSYDFSPSLTFNEFESWGHLVDGGTGRWFYNTLDAEAPFIINIQRTRPDEYGNFDLYIWSNHRIYYQGQIAGVVTIGSPFADIFNAAFYGFDIDGKRGYILDQYGAVRMDSAGILETTVAGVPFPPTVPEAIDNPNLAYEIANHLQRLQGGLFPLGILSGEAVRLAAGDYYYASISPIIGTNWSVMVLSGSVGGFDVRFMPVIIVAFVLLVVFLIAASLASQRMILNPLRKLAQSTNEIDEDFNTAIYGVERADIIGTLATTIRSMLDKVKISKNAMEQAQDELRYREKLLSATNQAAEVLLAAKEEDTMSALMYGMEIVGRCVNADRVQIWRNEIVDGELHFVMRYEWLSEIGEQKVEVPTGLKFPYKKVDGWLEMFLRGEGINSPISKLPPRDAAFLGYYEMVSIVCLPLFMDGEFIGFFSVDDCQFEKVYTDDEINMFASAGLMFTNVFNRSKQKELAYTDSLTGVYNRRYFLETAEITLRRCIEESSNFSLIMMDIDHFKSINDRFGHAIGDEVLKIFTARIRHVLKKDTLFARYGGEEFAVELEGVSQENAVKTALRLSQVIQDTPFQIDGLELNVTASFGVASKTSVCTLLEKIINNSDKALYQAKSAGRNTVIGYTEEPEAN